MRRQPKVQNPEVTALMAVLLRSRIIDFPNNSWIFPLKHFFGAYYCQYNLSDLCDLHIIALTNVIIQCASKKATTNYIGRKKKTNRLRPNHLFSWLIIPSNFLLVSRILFVYAWQFLAEGRVQFNLIFFISFRKKIRYCITY